MNRENKRIKCYYCGDVFGKVAIKRHLEKCKVREEKKKPGEEKYFWIQV